MSQNKESLRKRYKAARLSVEMGSTDEKSLEICRKIFRTVDWGAVDWMCSYSPIEKLKEVDVRPLHDTIRYKFPKIEIVLLGQDKRQSPPKKRFDLIIVPCLAFDKDNYRLGWGGGFYDRFLARQPQAVKIGAAYQDSFVAKGLPHEPQDIPLDMIITER